MYYLYYIDVYITYEIVAVYKDFSINYYIKENGDDIILYVTGSKVCKCLFIT